MTAELQSELDRLGDAEMGDAINRIAHSSGPAQDRFEEMIERAAAKAVRSALREIGLYAETEDKRDKIRRSVTYLSAWTAIIEKAAVVIGTAFLTGIAAAILAVIWAGIRLHMLKQP